MTRPCQDGFSLLTATGLVGLAGVGAAFGAVPALGGMPDPWVAAPLAVLGVAAWLRARRERRIAARLQGLRISVSLPMAGGGLREEALRFSATGRTCWQARRQGWRVELLRLEAEALCWQLSLARLDSADPALPLASAASLDALLCLSRGLLPGMAQPGLAELLDCDLAFALPGLASGENGITALAEGGYALSGPDSCLAVAPAQAEALLLRGSAVVAF